MNDDRDQSAEGSVDARLSAWIDGELDADAASQLRAELDADPRLAKRLRELEAVDLWLRELRAPRVSADAKALLRERIAAVEIAGPDETEPVRAASAASPARRRRAFPRGLALASAAALFGLVLYGSRSSQEGPEPERAPTRIAERPSDASRSESPNSESRSPNSESLNSEAGNQASAPSDLEELLDAVQDEDPQESELAFAEDLAPDDVSIVEVLDWLEALDELETVGRG